MRNVKNTTILSSSSANPPHQLANCHINRIVEKHYNIIYTQNQKSTLYIHFIFIKIILSLNILISITHINNYNITWYH